MFGQEVVRSRGSVHPALQLDVLTHYHESHMFGYAAHRKVEGDDEPTRWSSRIHHLGRESASTR